MDTSNWMGENQGALSLHKELEATKESHEQEWERRSSPGKSHQVIVQWQQSSLKTDKQHSVEWAGYIWEYYVSLYTYIHAITVHE